MAQLWVYYSSYLKRKENLLHVLPKMCNHSKSLQINLCEAVHMKGFITKKSCMMYDPQHNYPFLEGIFSLMLAS